MPNVNLCPSCASPLVMTEEDAKFNNSRLEEQKEIRAVGAQFKFNLRYTCSLCGIVFVERTVRRK